MKVRIKKLLITGFIFTGVTIGGLLLISTIRKIPITLIKLSDTLFSEFLILIALASFLIIREELLFKIKENRKKEVKKEEDKRRSLNSGLELIVIGLPIVIVSILITLI
jgi:heme/copper-type cytochrome/quinol oxidase subunit 2